LIGAGVTGAGVGLAVGAAVGLGVIGAGVIGVSALQYSKHSASDI
jgi:hypothetical protein